jgi:hypothetical protein
VAVAVIKKDYQNALVALTSAALSLPGLSIQAAVPASGIKANVSYGHYQESDGRMRVDVYHADAVIPLSDRLELAFSLDRDTYTGATPAFSMPEIMAYQPKYKQKSDGSLATDLSNVDVVSAASGGVTASGLTILGGLNGFKAFEDYRKNAEAKISFESEQANQEFISQLSAANAAIDQSVAADITPYTELKNTQQLKLDQNYSQNQKAYANAYPVEKQPITDAYDNNLSQLDANYLANVNNINASLPQLTEEYNNNLNNLNSAKTAAEQAIAVEKATSIIQLDTAKTQAEADYLTNNPRPADPDSISSAVTIKFSPNANNPNGMQYSAYSGSSNTTPLSGGNCVGSGPGGCFYENGMVVGIVKDSSNPIAHLHRGGSSSNRRMSYHSDSSGIYIRSLDSKAFSLDSMDFKSPINDENPDTGANDYWEILGFNQAENLDLDKGDGSNYATRVAYQTIANGFNGSLSLNSDFKNIKAFWIHYRGYPQTPTDGKQFGMELDNINISPVIVPTAQQTVWDSALQLYTTTYQLTVYEPGLANVESTYIQKKSTIETDYNNQKQNLDNTYKTESEALVGANQAALDALNASYKTEKNNLSNATQAQIDALNIKYAELYKNLAATYQIDSEKLSSDYVAKQQEITASYEDERKAVDNNYNTARSEQQKLDEKRTKQAQIAAYAKVLNSKVPTGTPTVQRFQIQPQETREMPQFTAKYFFDATTLAASGGFSDEPDFLSNFGSLNISHEFNDKLTTLSGGYGLTSNTITRGGMGHAAHADGHDHYGAAEYPALNEDSLFHNFNTSLSQVISKNTLVQSTASFTHQSGYLSNPYKYVYIRGEITPEEYYQMYADGDTVNWDEITQLEVVGTELFREVRPDKRNIFSLSNRVNQYLPELDASIHFDYRFYTDDWNVNSHTFELKWFQSLPGGFMVTPGIRYYSQSAAEFFAPYFLAPRADGHYSSDFRLSAFGDLSGGVTVSKEFARGITLEAGIEYTTHAGDLKLGGGGVGDYADFNYYMAHANLNVDLSARPFTAIDHAGHDMHSHHHGAPVPAGVMFAHMMNKADDIMVGYRYQYGIQNGSMLQGSQTIDDTQLVGSACQNNPNGCLYKPVQMQMQMHMLDFMYAPTDWLNLMVMPQLMSMDMDMSQPLRSFASIDEKTAYGHHASTTHTSNDIGDTLVTALVKLADIDRHHVHVGIGMSAPTGAIDAELSPGDLENADSTKIAPGSAVLQDYGMQLGSGTWDFKPSLTYTGHQEDWGWGAQLSGTKRLGKNKYDYAYGDLFQATSWGSYAVFDWLSATVRGVYTWQDKIQGQTTQTHDNVPPVDFPENYGGCFWDIGLGFNIALPAGKFAGHSLGFEWLQPVATNFNGSQLEREGALSATWSFSF